MISAAGGEVREDGTPYALHPLLVAEILLDWGADSDTVCAGVLHDILEDSDSTAEALEEQFGPAVAALVQGVTKFTNADLGGNDSLDRKIETLRRLFEVMRDDIRVLIIKLADRLHNVRTMDVFSPDRARRFARETLDIYAKLAWHVGMNDVRREFSNTCTPYVFPDETAKLLPLREHMVSVIAQLAENMEALLLAHGAEGLLERVYWGTRSLLPLVMDMQKSHFSEDRVAFIVIIAHDEHACYSVLKILHSLYRPKSGQFHDYIAAPSGSGYRALHTTVIDQAGHSIEVRIRTPVMEQQERRGILERCFSGGLGDDASFFPWLQRSEQLDQETRESSAAFWEALQSDILLETVQAYVDGREMLLPQGATLLDALYARHGSEAHRTQGTTRNGGIARLSDTVRQDDVITGSFGPVTSVSFEWLKAVATGYARTLVTAALKEHSKEEQFRVGTELLQREFDHYGKGIVGELTRAQQQHVAENFHQARFEDLVALVGAGVILPRDVVFYLFPLHRRRLWHASEDLRYPFCLSIRGAGLESRDVLQEISGIAGDADVNIQSAQLRHSGKAMSFEVIIRGVAPTRGQFANFLTALERRDWASQVQSRLSSGQRLLLIATFLFAAAIVIADILLLPAYQERLTGSGSLMMIVLQMLPLLPILAANYYMLTLLRHYLVRLREDRWFLGLGFILNISGIVLVLWKLPVLQGRSQVYPAVFLFAVSMLFLSYRYVQTYFALEPGRPEEAKTDLSPEEVRARKKKKMAGYLLRFCAVLIWGLEPVFIRYTPMQTLSPLLRVHIWGVIGGCCGLLAIFLMNRCAKKESRLRYTTSYNPFFWIIVFANISYNYFLHASLQFTTATNVNLALGYAPIFSLLLGFVIWRKRIVYFQSPIAVQQMLVVFGLSAIGGSLLFLSDIQYGGTNVVGDLMALLIAFSDVAFMMANIYYVKYSNTLSNTLALTAQHLLWIGLLTGLAIPVINLLLGSDISYFSLTHDQWVASILLGVITMIGFVLTFEAFRRIDGLLAFLMLNLAPVIAFIPEFIFYNVHVTPFFFLGAFLIIGASILAEMINTRCEKAGI